MRSFVLIILLLATSFASADAGLKPPEASLQYLPILKEEAIRGLPNVHPRSTFGGQTEQEAGPCPSKKCWNPRAELKTPRELGTGLGQLTISYKQDGTVRFSAYDDVRRMDESLRNWAWADRYDPKMQLRALVAMDRNCLNNFAKGAVPGRDANAMMLACYNGGGGGLRSDRLVCRNTLACDPARWWDHVERTSNKSRVKWNGYGKSAFEINRDYPRMIEQRAARYRDALGD